ncbi:DUF3304 domain-containing protein [Pseudomonas sp.]|jgi:hypothetical protein|uniref:DUF3304 domain-containing protein n=1 Tax=Pseudomonas sp. TaxID=306 RepID=UPI002EDAB215
MKRINLGMFLGGAVILIAVSNYAKYPRPEPVIKKLSFGSSVTPMDHDMSDTFVRPVYVDGHWVGAAGTGGSTVAGALSLPAPWHPGLTVRVKWRRCEPYGKNCRWNEKHVLVHPYDYTARTWLHILENDDVLIIPSGMWPRHDDYPGPKFPQKNFYK